MPSAYTDIVPGGDGGDAFDATDIHHEVNDEIDKDRADCIAIDPGMDIDLVEKDEDVDFDELVKHWDDRLTRSTTRSCRLLELWVGMLLNTDEDEDVPFEQS